MFVHLCTSDQSRARRCHSHLLVIVLIPFSHLWLRLLDDLEVLVEANSRRAVRQAHIIQDAEDLAKGGSRADPVRAGRACGIPFISPHLSITIAPNPLGVQ